MIARCALNQIQRNKMESKCLLVGYDDKSKAYHCYNLVTQKIMINKYVVFYEQFVGLQGLPIKQVANICNKYNYIVRILPKKKINKPKNVTPQIWLIRIKHNLRRSSRTSCGVFRL